MKSQVYAEQGKECCIYLRTEYDINLDVFVVIRIIFLDFLKLCMVSLKNLPACFYNILSFEMAGAL